MGNLDWDKDKFPNPTKMMDDLNKKALNSSNNRTFYFNDFVKVERSNRQKSLSRRQRWKTIYV